MYTEDLLATTDHKTILEWTRMNQGIPIMRPKDSKGIKQIAIDFSGGSANEDAVAITWEEWLRIFDKRRLVFLYGGHAGYEPAPHYLLESKDSLLSPLVSH